MQQLESQITDPLHKSRGACLWPLKLEGPDSHHESADTALELGHMQTTAQEPKVTTEEFRSTASWIALTCVCSVMSDSLQPHGLQSIRLLCPWDFPDKNTGVGCHFLLQGIFLTQGLNPGLWHWRHTLCHLSYQGRSIFKSGDTQSYL